MVIGMIPRPWALIHGSPSRSMARSTWEVDCRSRKLILWKREVEGFVEGREARLNFKKTVCSTELTIQFCDVSWPFYLLNWWETSISTERLEKTGYPFNLQSPAETTKRRNDLGVSGVLVFFVEMNWVDVGWKVLILGDVRIHHGNRNVSDFSMKTTSFFKPSKLELRFMRQRKEHWEWK